MADNDKTQRQQVQVVLKPNTPLVTVSGPVASLILWAVEYEKFLTDRRNAGSKVHLTLGAEFSAQLDLNQKI